MTRLLTVICALAALAVGWVLLRPDPWDLAAAKAHDDAAALAGFSDRPDRIGFYLGQDPALAHAVLWGGDGALRYPEQDGFFPLQYDLPDEVLREIAALRAGVDSTRWIAFDRWDDQLLNCRSTPAICLIYDRQELQAALALGPRALIGGAGLRIRAALFAMICLVSGAAVLWRTRRRRAETDRLELLPERHSARRGKLEVPLTPRDVRILELLKNRDGGVVTKDELYDAGWGRDFMPNSRALDQHIVNLRRKLDPDKSRATLIETVRGVGYRLVP